jgi:hypothetical protein
MQLNFAANDQNQGASARYKTIMANHEYKKIAKSWERAAFGAKSNSLTPSKSFHVSSLLG